MRDVPAGIELQRARGEDQPRLMSFLMEAISAYQEWAPRWTPQPPSPEARERLDGILDDDERAWALLALDGDEIAGVVSLSVTTGADAQVPDEDTIFLWQMFVREDWQGSGLAQALMDRVAEEARRRGKSRMVLWAAAGAAQARRFYEKEGWVLTGRTDDESDFGLPLVQYGLDL